VQPILDAANQQNKCRLIVDFEARKVKRLDDVMPIEVGITLMNGFSENFRIPALRFMVI